MSETATDSLWNWNPALAVSIGLGAGALLQQYSGTIWVVVGLQAAILMVYGFEQLLRGDPHVE